MATNMQFVGVLLLCLCITSSSYFDPSQQDEQAHDYLRFADVKRHCKSVLSAATKLTYDGSRASRVKRELSFEKGDWRQDAGDAPLLPFDGSDAPEKGSRRLLDPLSLATFVVTHVDDEEHRAGTAINVSGVLVLTVSWQSAEPEYGQHMSVVSPEFNLSAGSTKLKIIFEGVYTESAKSDGDGERMLCMVGSAVLPTRGADRADPWEWAMNSGRRSYQPPLTADNNILLVLRYPTELTLTTRAVLGEMSSTSAASHAAYFDTVHLVSGLTTNHNCLYQFRPEEVFTGVRDALTSSDADNDVVESRGARKPYNGRYPCDVFRRFAYGKAITVLPGWQCNSTTATASPCSSVGPFEMDRAADADELAGIGIVMQDLWCQQQQGFDMADTSGAALVAAVFRAVSPWEDWRTASQRTGLGGKTLSAEGMWNASTGQACMVACRGVAAGSKACHFRVCLYFPTTISIAGRDTMLGRITGVDAAGGAARPALLSFRQRMHPPRLWGYFPDDGQPLLKYKYSYTKVKQAGELRRRSQSLSDVRKIIAVSLPLIYPKRDGAGDDRRSLASLADTLTLRFTAVPSLFRHELIERPVLHLEVFFLEQLIDRYVPLPRDASSSLPRNEPAGSEWHALLNVSAELAIFDKHQVSSSVMSLEGVYDAEDGRMYLIGCRDVGLPRRRNSSTSRDLDDGMDCSVEVNVEYPPTTMHWFTMSTAKIRIASTRNAVDPRHFDTVKLRALPIRYPQQRPDGFYRGIVNGVLCIVLLSAAIAAALSQLRHLESHADVAPYVSLVMLGVQALGYGVPLITGIDALLATVSLRSFSDDDAATAPSTSPSSYQMFDASRLCLTIDEAVKVLTLGAFVLTLRLAQEVRRSRARMLARSPQLDQARVPDDGKVLAFHYGIHLILFVLVLTASGRAVTVEQHVALMQDLFLLPQAIGNAVWRVNCRPLATSFYAGVTAVRLLPHVYDYARPRAGLAGVYYSSKQGYVNGASRRGSFFAEAGDVVVPLAAVGIALVVHAQHRWNYAILSRMGKSEQKKLQHIF